MSKVSESTIPPVKTPPAKEKCNTKCILAPTPAPSSVGFPDPITESTTAFDKCFDQYAESLINHCTLVVCGESMRFRELEFYLHHPWHPDLYAHRDSDLRRCHGWYFHKIGRAYMGGTCDAVHERDTTLPLEAELTTVAYWSEVWK